MVPRSCCGALARRAYQVSGKMTGTDCSNDEGAATTTASGSGTRERPGAEGWKRAHAELVRLARRHAALDREEGTWLLQALRHSTHLRLGFASFAEYAGRLFGHSPRLVSDKLRVAEALEELPQLAAALEAGQLSWSALRELTRVAAPATEAEWLRVATGRPVREIERLVSGHRPGDRPEDAMDPKARLHVLRFDVSAETLATFREMMARVRRDAGTSLDDDAALLLVAGARRAQGRRPRELPGAAHAVRGVRAWPTAGPWGAGGGGRGGSGDGRV